MELHVLIVDDPPAMRGFIRRVLEPSGLEVGRLLEASHGEEALRLLEDNWVDVVLTGINMPQMDGEELLRRVSGHEVLHLIPVLVVSTDRTEGRIQKMLTLGQRDMSPSPSRRKPCAKNWNIAWGCCMEPHEIRTALPDADEEVLETMCFTTVLASAEGIAPPSGGSTPAITAKLRFLGTTSGGFRVSVPVKLACVVGAGFLWREETDVSDSQAGEVVCELANMICGSVLSRLESQATFQLTHLETAPSETGAGFGGGTCRWFELGNGILTVSMEFQQTV